jgi:SAM-dependent methyltransferase
MNYLSRAYIIKYHKDQIKKFGIDSNDALGWKDKIYQRLRFDALIGSQNLNARTVLDVGCGTCDLLEYLKQKEIECFYTGIDQMIEFIELASQKNINNINCSFLLGDFWTADLGQYDYVFASGALSYRNSDKQFIYKVIARLFALSKIAFVFNLLETTKSGDGILIAYDKADIFEFCKKLSGKVMLNDSYIKGDYTISMFK